MQAVFKASSKNHALAAPVLLQLLLLQQCLLASQCLTATASHHTSDLPTWRSSDDAVFTSGTVPLDTHDEPVSAHEGWLLANEDAYYWYGTSQKHNMSDGQHWDWLSDSVLLYTSHDLSAWKRRATVLSVDDVPYAVRHRLLGSSNDPLRMERPKVVYNAARRYYVLVVSLGSLDRSKAEVGWAVSVSPYGPFKFDGSRQPDGLPSYDITVAADGDSDAWLARAVAGTGIVISKLTPDFLDTAGSCAVIALRQQQQHLQASQAVPHPAALASTPAQLQQVLRDDSEQQAAGNSAASGAWLRRPYVREGWVPLGVLQAVTRWWARLTVWRLTAPTEAFDRSNTAVIPPRSHLAEAVSRGGVGGAPCLFKFDGKWYLMATLQAGWAPTRAVLYVNDGSSPCNESSWRRLPSPAKGPGASRVFNSTPAFVYAHSFKESNKELLIYFGDRWHPDEPSGPDAAKYLWLPLVPAVGNKPQPDSLQLLNLDSWRLGDYRSASHDPRS